MRLLRALPAAVLCITPLACLGQDYGANDPSQQPNNNNGMMAPGQYNNGMPPNGMAPGGMAPGGAPNPYGGQPGAYPAPGGAPAPAAPQGGGAATPIAPAAAMAASLPLQAMAQAEAPGMQPDGGAFAGQFQEGQVLEQPINLQPGKCYTIIGVGMGVQEVSIQLVTQPIPGMPPIPLAQSSTNGPQATLGGNKQCWKYMAPIGAPGKVLLKATRGSGMAVAEVFIK